MFDHERAPLSPGVRRMLSLRMNAAHGVPTVWEKIADWFQSRAEPALTAAERALLALFKPILAAGEAELTADLVSFAKGVLTQLETASTLEAAAQLVMKALEAEGGDLLALARSLGAEVWQALIALALADLGKAGPPAAA
jgi:long-subunit acyl-CoA synthetase (AMP-forming)